MRRASGSSASPASVRVMLQEQIGPQLPLQRLDLLGQGRLGDVHQIRGPGEVPGLRDGDEVLKLLELHGVTIARTYRIKPHHVLDRSALAGLAS
jgi:hypothetical protein